MTDQEEKVFKAIIDCQIGCCTSFYAPSEAVVTMSSLVHLTKLTKYAIRKALKSLMQDGLIAFKSQGCPAVESCGEYRELVCEAAPPINGYCLTDKGYSQEMYKQADKEFNESMKRWANEHED